MNCELKFCAQREVNYYRYHCVVTAGW